MKAKNLMYIKQILYLLERFVAMLGGKQTSCVSRILINSELVSASSGRYPPSSSAEDCREVLLMYSNMGSGGSSFISQVVRMWGS